MYEKYQNENNIWETLNYGFPVSKSSTCDPDLERAVKIDAVIKAEEIARIEEDRRINGRVDTEIEEREKADDVLGNMIAKEVNDRTSADNALDARIKLLEQGGGSGTGYDDTELRNRVGALETSQTTQDGKISVLETDVNALKTSQTEQDEKIAALEAEEPDLTELKGKVTALETSQTVQDGKITALETSQAEQDTKIEVLENVDANQATEIANLGNRVAELEQGGSSGTDSFSVSVLVPIVSNDITNANTLRFECVYNDSLLLLTPFVTSFTSGTGGIMHSTNIISGASITIKLPKVVQIEHNIPFAVMATTNSNVAMAMVAIINSATNSDTITLRFKAINSNNASAIADFMLCGSASFKVIS